MELYSVIYYADCAVENNSISACADGAGACEGGAQATTCDGEEHKSRVCYSFVSIFRINWLCLAGNSLLLASLSYLISVIAYKSKKIYNINTMYGKGKTMN